MQKTLTDQATGGPNAILAIANYPVWTYLVIQVQGPGAIRIASAKDVLQQSGAGGSYQGLQITAAMGFGMVALWWIGTLFAVAESPQVICEFAEIRSPGAPTP